MTKLCRDCKHSIQDGAATWWQCRLARQVSPVDGSESFEQCSMVRVTLSKCGPAASWFEASPDAVDQEPPDQYNREQALGDEEPHRKDFDIDQYADDPRRGQASEINRK